MLKTKLKAGALQMTLFLIVVIALLLSAFIVLVHTQKLFKTQTDFIIETAQNSNKGVHYTLNNTVKLKDSIIINLKGQDYKSLKVYRDYWGLYEKVISISQIKKNTVKKVTLLGASQNNLNRPALYLQDNNRPLVLVGNTKIEGLSYLPRQGVKPGTISGQSYYGTSLIYGPTRTATTLPKLAVEMVTQLNELNTISNGIFPKDYLTIQPNKQYNNSFLSPTKLIYNNSIIRLSHISLTGNILIKSNSKIVVEPTAQLEDVILIAPEVDIKAHVKGNFQVIASRKITAHKNVTLDYPSALVLIEQDTYLEEESLGQIEINPDASIKGQIIFLAKKRSNNYKPQIVIGDDANITGEIYCDGNLELKGSIVGSVFTNNFVANQFGSVYQNHIYNGAISTKKLPEEYIGLAFNNSKKRILKWLY